MTRIFISYRRSISHYPASIVNLYCIRHFGAKAVFFDLKGINPGDEFPDRIKTALDSCEVFLLVIGKGWSELKDARGPFLNNENDWVRQEILRVLQRNSRRADGEKAPVLIIPLLERSAGKLKPGKLPDSLRPLCDIQTHSFSGDEDLDALRPRIEDHLGDPFTGPFGLRLLLQKPDMSTDADYRFRSPTISQHLDPYVVLSDAEVDITATNPDLSGPQRLLLYESWCKWTAVTPSISWHDPGNSVASFMSLERRSLEGSWSAAAISIILPLSRRGGSNLIGYALPEGFRPSDKFNATSLLEDDLQRGRSHCLLLDTWIVAKETGAQRAGRIDHGFWAKALVLRHLAEVWDGAPDRPTTILVEPDNPKIGRMLSQLGFEKHGRNAQSGDIYFLEYPLNPYRYPKSVIAELRLLFRKVSEWREYPVLRET